MNNELNALADLLHAAGWTSPNDAQWTRLDAAIPTIRNLLSRPALRPSLCRRPSHRRLRRRVAGRHRRILARFP